MGAYLAKSMHTGDQQGLENIKSDLLRHFQEDRRTLLLPIFGVFKRGREWYQVLPNVQVEDETGAKPERITSFDIKGSLKNRIQNFPQKVGALKDKNLISYFKSIKWIHEEQARMVMHALDASATFCMGKNLVDYSLI